MRNARMVSWAGIAVAAAAAGGVLAARAEPREPAPRKASGILRLVEALGRDLVAPAAAVAKAAEKAPGAVPVAIELTTADGEGGRAAVWEVELLGDGVLKEVLVDARSGAVLSVKDEKDEKDVKEYSALLARGKVGLPAALATSAAASKGLLLRASLDDEDDGTAVWESVFVHGGLPAEILVSSASGVVVPDDGEDDDGDDDDDDHDEDDDGDDDDGPGGESGAK